MPTVRILAGTRKGAFILTADTSRTKWKIDGPHFGGWAIYHMAASPVDPNRLYVSQPLIGLGKLSSAVMTAARLGSNQVPSRAHPRSTTMACHWAKATNLSITPPSPPVKP
ncbi:MAG: hypothetical protein ACI95C_001069 [Pseudohongiellaceae bacterium]|jgi:hypothetical protein